MTEDELPRWSRFRHVESRRRHDVLPHWREYARGWPMHSLFCWMEEDTQTFTHRTFHAINAPFRAPAHWQRRPEEVLPIGIIWPGFAINTLFYAAILWLLFAMTFALRRRRRIRRGLCPTCAYPIGSSDTCTECGAVVKPRSGVGM